MKTEHISSIFGIILKGVATICIVLATYFYMQNKDTGKYISYPSEYGVRILNTQSGEITIIGETVRIMINPFEEDINKIVEKELISQIEDE